MADGNIDYPTQQLVQQNLVKAGQQNPLKTDYIFISANVRWTSHYTLKTLKELKQLHAKHFNVNELYGTQKIQIFYDKTFEIRI